MERVHHVNLKRQKSKNVDLQVSSDSIKSMGVSSSSLEGSQVSGELTSEELLSMTCNDRQAEDISNQLLQTAGSPKVEPNPGRLSFINRAPKATCDRVDMDSPSGKRKKNSLPVSPMPPMPQFLPQFSPEAAKNFKINTMAAYKCHLEPCSLVLQKPTDRIQLLKHFVEFHPQDWSRMTATCKLPPGLPRIFEILHNTSPQGANLDNLVDSYLCPICTLPCNSGTISSHIYLAHNL
ncbi:hypothetical protein Ciccas_011565 [Cichlidogyrus casuarinus]|uniref:C2H2-type domain-containing protein n=1 Tax=Cichlidogyrus casuarinus TaxID=1844966 RepID=A0ABD2PSK5_9PLAT